MRQMKKWLTSLLLVVMMIIGTYFLLQTREYTSVNMAASYKKDISDTNHYAAFSDGIVRYSRDGVVYLDKKNKEKWIHPCQIQNPIIDVNEEAFAIADRGGNTILIFTKEGVKGEVETTLPIEKISVSNQGVVSAILKNETTPLMLCYDAMGNILVEHQVNANATGYPIAIDIAPNGEMLAISYLSTKNGELKSKIIYYSFGEAGQDKTDHQVYIEEYDNEIVPSVFFMDMSTSVSVGERSFTIYEGIEEPKKVTEVSINQEIRSEFHTDKYIGFVLMNEEKSGYEIQLYNKAGVIIMKRAIEGEYSNVKMVEDEIIMFDGTKGCIVSHTGILRFKGDWDMEVLEVIPTMGIHRYILVGTDELRVINLTN